MSLKRRPLTPAPAGFGKTTLFAGLIEHARVRSVAHLMAQGATNGKIALTLGLSVETIKRHVRNILSKLGVGNRTQASARAHDLGLLLDASIL